MVQKVARLRQSYCAKMHRNACYAGYKIRGNGNVIRCFFFLFQFHLKIGSHFIAKTNVTIANLNSLYRKITVTSSWIASTCKKSMHSLSLATKSTRLQEKTKHTEYISCYWYTLRIFFFWLYYQSTMARFSILNYTLPLSSFNASYDWNSRHESRKKYCFHVLEGKN